MRVNLFFYFFTVVYYEFSKISPPPLSKNIEDITTMDYIFRLCDNFLLSFKITRSSTEPTKKNFYIVRC